MNQEVSSSVSGDESDENNNSRSSDEIEEQSLPSIQWPPSVVPIFEVYEAGNVYTSQNSYIPKPFNHSSDVTFNDHCIVHKYGKSSSHSSTRDEQKISPQQSFGTVRQHKGISTNRQTFRESDAPSIKCDTEPTTLTTPHKFERTRPPKQRQPKSNRRYRKIGQSRTPSSLTRSKKRQNQHRHEAVNNRNYIRPKGKQNTRNKSKSKHSSRRMLGERMKNRQPAIDDSFSYSDEEGQTKTKSTQNANQSFETAFKEDLEEEESFSVDEPPKKPTNKKLSSKDFSKQDSKSTTKYQSESSRKNPLDRTVERTISAQSLPPTFGHGGKQQPQNKSQFKSNQSNSKVAKRNSLVEFVAKAENKIKKVKSPQPQRRLSSLSTKSMRKSSSLNQGARTPGSGTQTTPSTGSQRNSQLQSPKIKKKKLCFCF